MERLPSWGGTRPPNIAEERERYLRFLRPPMNFGTGVPVNLSPLSSSVLRFFKPSKDELI